MSSLSEPSGPTGAGQAIGPTGAEPAAAAPAESAPPVRKPRIEVQDLVLAYGTRVLLQDLTFTVRQGDVFVIMGGSGSGKSTLMRNMLGLNVPAAGQVRYGGVDFFESGPGEQAAIRLQLGVMYQQGALWSSMTLLENVSLP